MKYFVLNFISIIMTWGKLHFWILPTGKPIHLLLIYYLFLFTESLFFILWILTLNLQQGDFCISFVSSSWIYGARLLWWSSSRYCPMRNSDGMTIGKAYGTSLYNSKLTHMIFVTPYSSNSSAVLFIITNWGALCYPK